MFWSKNKKLNFYVVMINEDNTKDEPSFASIVNSRQEVYEYISRRVFLENQEHYKLWCETSHLPYEDEKTWLRYSAVRSELYKKFVINRISYTKKDLAVILRIFNGCIPVGASYEHDLEVSRFLKRFPKEYIEDLQDMLQK